MSSFNVNENELILSHIENVEKQVRALTKELRLIKAHFKSLSKKTKKEKKFPLAAFKGITKGQVNASEEEIDAVLFKNPKNEDWY